MADWSDRKVVIIGAARQGLALARYLARHGATVLLNDRRPAGELRAAQASLDDLPAGSVSWAPGGHPLDVLDGADLLCPSGGVPLDLPLLVEGRRRGIPLSNDSQIFLEAAPCRVIGITGSAGKTTTTSLVGRMAEKARAIEPRLNASRVWVGGNIGSPLIAVVDEMGPDDLAVMELSSFQLELMTRSPHIAAILNVTPNHLDRHASMDEYTRAKARILAFQNPGKTGREPAPSLIVGRRPRYAWGCSAVLNREDPGSWGLSGSVRGRLFTFGLREPGSEMPGTFLLADAVTWKDGQASSVLLPCSSIGLRGEHNLCNVLAACAIAMAAGIPAEAMRLGVEGFQGVAHRLEFVHKWKGVSWYNDSIATAPERAIASIRSFQEPLVLLAGGRDKNLPWDEFAAVVRRHVDHLILFGEAAEKIEQALEVEKQAAGQDWPYTVTRCAGLEQAVQAASRVAEPGDVVLLAPGGTSFDEFRDFEERGEAYRIWVQQLM